MNEGLDVDQSLTDTEKVLRLLAVKKEIARRDVEALLGCSSFPATHVINELLLQGKIRRVGAARATRYTLV